MDRTLRCLIYGKIIIDDIRLSDGRVVRRVLGGGGPQAAFGAALWNDSVGLLSRSGTDIEEEHARTLAGLGVDLGGWQRFPDIPTTRGVMLYDENEYLIGGGVTTSREDWLRLLGQPLGLPPAYLEPELIHLITEFADEPMVETALELRARGALFSLEPIIDYREWTNRESIVGLLQSVDLVTPDWPSASGIAGSDDPRQVMTYWAGLGPGLVAVRHGQYGSYVWSREHDEIWHVPAVPVPVIDPTGAGNAYGGGLCAGWLKTGDARLAGVYGAISAAFLVRRYGLPTMSALLRREAHARLDPTIDSTSRL